MVKRILLSALALGALGFSMPAFSAGIPNSVQTLAPNVQTFSNTVITTAQNPTGQASATFVMAGIDSGGLAEITPAMTGRVFITITGTATNGTAADGGNMKIMIAPKAGTGCANSSGTSSGATCLTPPSNNAAVLGTQCGGVQQFVSPAGVIETVPFTLTCVVTGLQIGRPVWYDVAFQQVTGGTVTLANVAATAFEF